jgi:hypothetical protein
LLLEIVARHEQSGGKLVRLLLNLTIHAVPTCHVLRAAIDSVRELFPVHKVMAEFVRNRKIDPTT